MSIRFDSDFLIKNPTKDEIIKFDGQKWRNIVDSSVSDFRLSLNERFFELPNSNYKTIKSLFYSDDIAPNYLVILTKVKPDTNNFVRLFNSSKNMVLGESNAITNEELSDITIPISLTVETAGEIWEIQIKTNNPSSWIYLEDVILKF